MPGDLQPLRYQRHKHRPAHDALRLADNVGHDHALIHLDTQHMNITEKDLPIWRDLWPDGADLAVHSRRCITNHLQANAVR